MQAGNHGLATRSSVDCNGEGVAGLGPLSREGGGLCDPPEPHRVWWEGRVLVQGTSGIWEASGVSNPCYLRSP